MPERPKAHTMAGKYAKVKLGPDTGKEFLIVDWLVRASNLKDTAVGYAAQDAVDRLMLYGGPDPNPDYMLYGQLEGKPAVYHQDELDLDLARMR